MELLDFLKAEDNEELRLLSGQLRKFSQNTFAVSGSSSLSFKREHFSEMAKLGLTGLGLSEDKGGVGLSPMHTALTIFEIAKTQLGPSIYLSVHLMVLKLIERFGEDAHFKALLSEMASGKKLGAFCLTEAKAGSDASAVETKFTVDGDSFVISGEKIYITSGGHADVYLVFAKDASKKESAISAFVVEKSAKGLSFGNHEKKMGCEGSPISNVLFEFVKVPKSALVGKIDEGYKIALSGLNGGRVNIAAAACGVASDAIFRAREHLLSRKQFGKTLSEFQGLQFMLADMVIAYQGAVELTKLAAEKLSTSPGENSYASIAKCFATDAAMKITTDAVQLLGGAGYIEEYQVERLMRDAKMLQIVEGTNQIQRVILAKAVLS